jgi:hypothetical protein
MIQAIYYAFFTIFKLRSTTEQMPALVSFEIVHEVHANKHVIYLHTISLYLFVF